MKVSTAISLIRNNHLYNPSDDEISQWAMRGDACLNLSMLRKARQLVKGVITPDMSDSEAEDALRSVAVQWLDSLSHEVDNEVLGPVNYRKLQLKQRREDADRYNNWLSHHAETESANPQAFYVVAHMPQINYKFDTRRNLFVFDKKLRRPVKKLDRAIWRNPMQARIFIYTQILLHANILPESTGDVAADNAAKKQALNDWLNDNNLRLRHNFVDVESVHSVGEFPCMWWSLDAAWDTSQYELEDSVVRGLEDDVVDNSLEAAFHDKQGNVAKGVVFPDLQEGIDSYAATAIQLGRYDLAELACSATPECPMDPDIAWAVVEGDIMPRDAAVLWSSYSGSLDIAGYGWLAQAIDVLVAADQLDVPDKGIEALFDSIRLSLFAKLGNGAFAFLQ